MPTYIDRCVQALYALALEPYMEEVSHPNSYGFRKARSPQWALSRLHSLLNNSSISWHHIIEVDVQGCFDNIDHNWIVDNVPFIPKDILLSWLKCGFVEAPQKGFNKLEPRIFPTEKGVPQGGIISPMICNIVLDGIDPAYPENKNGYNPRNIYIRFADDINILVRSGEDPQEVLNTLKELLKIRGLEVSNTKTKIIPLKGPLNEKKPSKFPFVGCEFLVWAIKSSAPQIKFLVQHA